MASISSTDLDTGGGVTSVGGDISDNAQAQLEIVRGGSQAASMMNNLATTWNQAAQQTPADDTGLQQRFMQNHVAPALQDFTSSFTTDAGKSFAASHAADMIEHFTNVTSADTASRLGLATHGYMDNMVHQYTDLVDKDPTSADTVRKMLSDSMDGIINRMHNAPPDVMAAMRGQLRDNALQAITEHEIRAKGAINPASMRAEIDSGRLDNFINRQDALTQLDQATRIAQAKKQADQFQQTQQNYQQFTDLGNQIATQAMSGQVTGQTWQQLQNFYNQPGANPQEAQAVTDYVKFAQSGFRAQPDAGVYMQFMERLADGRLNRTDVFNAMAQGQLSAAQGSLMVKNIASPDPNLGSLVRLAQQARKFMVTAPIGAPGYAAQMEQLSKADFYARQLLAGEAAKGVPLGDLLSPTSKSYIYGSLNPYVMTGKQLMLTQPPLPNTVVPVPAGG